MALLNATVVERILQVLPSIGEERLKRLSEVLIEVGVDDIEDVLFVHEIDLVKVLKPVRARKLLKAFQGVPDASSSESPASTSSMDTSDSTGSPVMPRPVIYTYNQDPNWPQKMNIPWNKVPEITFCLHSNKRLEPDSRKKLVRMVADEIRQITKNAYKRQFEIIAKRMVALYPQSLEDRIDGFVVGTGYDSLVYQLVNRNENLNRGVGKLFRKRKCSDVMGDDEKTQKPTVSPASKKRDSYGCVNWGPVIDGDSFELEKSKQMLKEMHDAPPSDWNNENIMKLMNDTYSLQKQSINEGESIGKIVGDWPFLSESVGNLCHFKTLVGIDCEAAIREGCESKGVRLQRYFSSEMRGELDPLFRAAQKESEMDNVKAWIPANLLCIMKCVNEKLDALFLLVDETASVADIERTNTESWPRLVLLGETHISAKQYMIIVDHKVIVKTITSFLKAVAVLFATFYVFNIQYQAGAAATLEFIQRCFLRINPDKGCKADRKRKTTGVNPKVLRMINSIAGFEWTPINDA